jgi:DNA replication protein DnaC
MENLGDILKKLSDTKRVPNGNDGGSDNGNNTDRDYPVEVEEVCPNCQGRGWLTPDVPVGHPNFGQVVACECQATTSTGERSARLRRYSNLGYLTRLTFDTLDVQGRAPDPESHHLFSTAVAVCRVYAEEPSGWLALIGPHGSGKTHLAAAIANMCIDDGRPVFFVHVPDLLDHLRASYAPTSDITYSDLFDQVLTAPLLILDGLGAQSSTPWAQEKLQQIFNHRTAGELPTIITTATELDDLDPYLASRIQHTGISRVLETRSRLQSPAHQVGRIEPQMIKHMTFESFNTRGNSPSAHERASLEAAFNAAQAYARDPHGWLTLLGDTGVGKTHLAVAIASERMQKGQPVFFAFVPELLEDLRRYAFDHDSGMSFDRVFQQVKNTPLLILDDLGQEQNTPWAVEKLYQIIVHRHNARLPTIITSSSIDVTGVSGPITSRVRDPSVSMLIHMDASDFRVKGRGGSKPSQRKASR